MRTLISGFVHDEFNARVLEYALVVASIVIATIVVVHFVSSAL